MTTLAIADDVRALVVLARRLCANRADADDLVQDTIERALRAPNYVERGAKKGWLATILRNQFRDYHREARREPIPLGSGGPAPRDRASIAGGMEETLPAEPVPGEAPPENWERYQLGPKLGEGGMGIVYRATDRTLGRDVAIKLIRGGNPTLALRLLKEARAQARIDHPGVCRVYDVGEIGGRGYIALQLVEGESLAHAARRMTLDVLVVVLCVFVFVF